MGQQLRDLGLCLAWACAVIVNLFQDQCLKDNWKSSVVLTYFFLCSCTAVFNKCFQCPHEDTVSWWFEALPEFSNIMFMDGHFHSDSELNSGTFELKDYLFGNEIVTQEIGVNQQSSFPPLSHWPVQTIILAQLSLLLYPACLFQAWLQMVYRIFFLGPREITPLKRNQKSPCF